jgi:spermidine/putrescine transport system substrate-binding protein
MYDIARESFVPALQKLGYSANTTDINELNEARDLLIVQRPLVQADVTTDGIDKMLGREGALALIYNGYAVDAMSQDNGDQLRYVVPREGGMRWFDSMVIPTTARHQAETEEFINFLLRPEIAAMNADYTGFSIAHMGAFELLDEELRECPIYWPCDDTMANAEILSHLGDFMSEIEDAWTRVKASRLR